MEQRFRRCKTYPNSLVRGFFLQLRRAFTREDHLCSVAPRETSTVPAGAAPFAAAKRIFSFVLAYGRESEVMLRSVGSNAMEEISGQRLHTRQMLRDFR